VRENKLNQIELDWTRHCVCNECVVVLQAVISKSDEQNQRSKYLSEADNNPISKDTSSAHNTLINTLINLH
jgi:hypothetical protein